MNDLFEKIFLHGLVSFATFFLWLLLNMFTTGEGFYAGLWVCILITNCTALILSKLNQILERLPEDGKTKIP